MDQEKDPAQKAYEAYVFALDGMAPAGVAGPPDRLQAWDRLPGSVRAAWVAALAAVAPEPEPEVELTEVEPTAPASTNPGNPPPPTA